MNLKSEPPGLLATRDNLERATNHGDWYVAYTQPKSEQLAANNLSRQGFDVYFALYKTHKKSIEGVVCYSVPMFARYVFFKPGHAAQSINTARSTRGVSFVLSFGFQVAAVKNVQLNAIKAFELTRNSLNEAEISPFQPGVKVRFAGSGVQGLDGIVTSVSSKRVQVLLELLGKQHTVCVDHQSVALA